MKINASMYIKVCSNNVFEERVRRIINIRSSSNEIENETIEKTDNFITVKGLKPCHKYKFNGNFEVDRLIKPVRLNKTNTVPMNFTFLTGKLISLMKNPGLLKNFPFSSCFAN